MKVGDKVQVIAEVYQSKIVGKIGVLKTYQEDVPYGCLVTFDDRVPDYVYDESELKVVEEYS